MRLLSVRSAVCVCVLSAAVAGVSWWRADGLRAQAAWLLERGQAQASEYTRSFNDTLAAQQLETFARRRAVLERAYLWQRLETLGILFAAAAAAGAWVLGMLGKIQDELYEVDAEAPAPEGGEPVSLRLPPPVHRSRP